MKPCLICTEPVSPFMSFGKQPIANGFLSKEDFNKEYFYEMEIAFCSNCLMVQLVNQPDKERMFHQNYAFYSSSSKHMAAHFEKFANDVIDRYSPSFVVEIGSNDGIMLKHFASRGIEHIGFEPSENVANVAMQNGVKTSTQFFDENVDIKQADIILAANVLAHISDIHSVMRGIKKILKPSGLFIFEDPYMGDILAKTSFDQIYDEHAFFFSLSSISGLVERHGMEVVDVQPQDVHGGSMRYTVANKNMHVISDSVRSLWETEEWLGLNNKATYDSFREQVLDSRLELITLLGDIKNDNKRIVGYAATAKSATVLNYCGIGSDLIECIYDTTPIKQGKYSPGAHIPVRSFEEFATNPPDYTVLFAWNHTREIMEKEKDYKGKWIVYVPEVRIIDSNS